MSAVFTPTSRARRAAGFTLIEVLVSLLILSVLAGAAWKGLDAISMARQVADENLQNTLRLQSVMTQLDADMAQVYDTQVVRGFQFDGANLRFTRRAAGGVQVVGRVAELWRYPVKSMGGSRVESVQLDGRGIHGDRLWAVRDLEDERTTSARRVPALLGRLDERYDPALIVVACNTASTIALNPVRAALDLPVIGTVPAIKPAAALSRTRTIGVLGTEATVVQPYIDNLAAEFAADCTVVRHGSAELVELAEAKLRGETTDADAYRSILAGLLDQPGGERIDTVGSRPPG